MIWHVIKKDLRSQWWLGLILIAATVGYAYAFWIGAGTPSYGWVRTLVSLWPYVGAGFALARFVQLDSPATRGGDWHTRPMSRRSLLIAKIGLALGGVIVPWGTIDFGLGMDWGLTPLQALSIAATHMAWVVGGSLVVMAIAAITSNLVQFLLVAVGLLSAGLLLLFVVMRVISSGDYPRPLYVAPGLLGHLFDVAVLGACLALLVIYGRRRLAQAWVIIVLATLGVELAGIAAACAFGISWPGVASAEPSQARDIKVEAAGPPVVRRLTPEFGFLSTPLKVTKPDGVSLEIERVLVARTLQSGQVQYSNITGGTLGWDLATSINLQQVSGPMKIDAKYRLRMRQTLDPIRVTDVASFRLPGGGSCRGTRGSKPGTYANLNIKCLAGDPICLDVTGGNRGPAGRLVTLCSANRTGNGFYYQEIFTTIDQLPMTIIPKRQLGTIDRGFSVGWSMPGIVEFDPGRSVRPSPPVNSN